ncbi:hypothetical protein J31TS4_02680 [Paenibacillus sp. J31TS4]|nr:hypothetical protein J31TS4_02680 [Paenibacillus sp. J31TS4]
MHEIQAGRPGNFPESACCEFRPRQSACACPPDFGRHEKKADEEQPGQRVPQPEKRTEPVSLFGLRNRGPPFGREAGAE